MIWVSSFSKCGWKRHYFIDCNNRMEWNMCTSSLTWNHWHDANLVSQMFCWLLPLHTHRTPGPSPVTAITIANIYYVLNTVLRALHRLSHFKWFCESTMFIHGWLRAIKHLKALCLIKKLQIWERPCCSASADWLLGSSSHEPHILLVVDWMRMSLHSFPLPHPGQALALVTWFPVGGTIWALGGVALLEKIHHQW